MSATASTSSISTRRSSGSTSAYSFVRDLVADNGTILFVGTKKQTQDPIARYAAQCGMPYINERWLGGMLTNFNTIAGRVKKMQEYERMRQAGDFEAMPKKEALILSRELEKLQRNLGGIRDMTRLPDAVFIIDTKKEHIAVTEANKLGLPIVAVVDTNCDPDLINYVIPGNDDAIRAGTLMCRVIADAVEEGRFIASRRAARSGAPAAAVEGPRSLDPGGGGPARRAAARSPPPGRPGPGRAGGPARAAPASSRDREGEPSARLRRAGSRAPNRRRDRGSRSWPADAGRPPSRRPRPRPHDPSRRSGHGRTRPTEPPTRSRSTTMAEFTAKDVKALRDATGAGMMDAKRALDETDGDFDAAAAWLRERGLGKAAERSGPREHRGRGRRGPAPATRPRSSS